MVTLPYDVLLAANPTDQQALIEQAVFGCFERIGG
jgi:hypothetical protein